MLTDISFVSKYGETLCASLDTEKIIGVWINTDRDKMSDNNFIIVIDNGCYNAQHIYNLTWEEAVAIRDDIKAMVNKK